MSRSTCSPSRRCGSNAAASRRAVSVWRQSLPAEPERVAAVHASAVDLDPEMSAGAALRRIARSCAEQIVGNEAAVLAGMPEGVHQMRVGVRRLRAILSAFAPLLPKDEYRRLSDELRWLGNVLGVARNLDVFADGLVAPAIEVDRRRARCDGARAPPFAERRAASYADAAEAIGLGALHRPRVAPDALVGAARRRGSVIGPALAAHRRGRSPAL